MIAAGDRVICPPATSLGDNGDNNEDGELWSSSMGSRDWSGSRSSASSSAVCRYGEVAWSSCIESGVRDTLNRGERGVCVGGWWSGDGRERMYLSCRSASTNVYGSLKWAGGSALGERRLLSSWGDGDRECMLYLSGSPAMTSSYSRVESSL